MMFLRQKTKQDTKILHFRSPAGFYGAENVILNLALQKPENNIIAILIDKRNPHSELAEIAESNGLKVIRIPSKGKFDPSVIAKLLKILWNEKIDILHCHDYKTIILSSFLPRLIYVKQVATLHGDTGVSKSVEFYESLTYRFLKTYDKIAVVSSTLKEKAEKFISKDKICLIPNGIDIDGLENRANQNSIDNIKKQLGIKDEKIILSIGRLSKEKGQDILIESIKIKKEFLRSNNVKFIIIGEGDLKDTLVSSVRNYNLDDLIIFTGSRLDVPVFYKMCTAVVMPSRTEGLPMVALESLAMGKQFIATNVGQLPILKSQGAPITLVPSDDPISLGIALENCINIKDFFNNKAKDFIINNYSSTAMANAYWKKIYF